MLGLRHGRQLFLKSHIALESLKWPTTRLHTNLRGQGFHSLPGTNTSATTRPLRRLGYQYEGTRRLAELGRGSRNVSFLRFIPARVFALPAMLGVGAFQGYDHLKKSTQLPDLPDLKLDELGDDAVEFLGKLTAQIREQQALNAKGHDDSAKGHEEAYELENDSSEDEDAPMHLPPLPQRKTSENAYSIIDRLQGQLDEAYTRHQGELIEERTRLQKEIERLMLDNEELRKSYLELHATIDGDGHGRYGVRSKRSAIEMYSDVLDLLSKYNKDFNVQDNLPRVIVVGDQSAGKTSVLEMLVQSRMFPRGHGEMMTRAPIQVTISEGPKKVARFADSGSNHSTSNNNRRSTSGKDREYDLTDESDLKILRGEIQRRMIASVKKGDTVSMDTISLNVRGPGLQRMVLVDLPGIIGHVTAGMASDTKEKIWDMCKYHVHNPNSIILCVQDGSVDAERSNVADLVSQVDPLGERTIFVLTKVDVAEAHNTASKRMKSIMEGRLFRMKALGYFAVVTGKGSPNESIEEIKSYEEEFFRTSRLFREGALRPHQTTTQNMARAVAQEFWNRVRVSVEEQAEMIRADLATKELQWKNTYAGRMMSREELFQLGKHEIMESIAHFGTISAREWEDMLSDQLWEDIGEHLVAEIYLNAARSARTTDFKTRVDVQLMDWARRTLPQRCVDLAKKTFMDRFDENVRSSDTATLQDSPEIFKPLRDRIIASSHTRHVWHKDVTENLRVIQINSLEDDEITDAGQWYLAVDFMLEKMKNNVESLTKDMRDFFGPDTVERWVYWCSRTPVQAANSAIRKELGQFFAVKQGENVSMPKSYLDYDDIITVRNNVKQSTGEDVSDPQINEVFEKLFVSDFLKRGVQSALYCKNKYSSSEGSTKDAPNCLECKDVTMFWRLQEMLHATSKTLRQQIMYHRAKLEMEVKQELENLQADDIATRSLITGERVELAQQIELTRHLLMSLDNFIRTISVNSKSG
eukprot:CFRG7762T1